MLTRGAAAEIVFGDDDLRVAIGGLVQHEIRVFRAVLIESHLREQSRAKARALDGLQILLGDDHVGVDVADLHGSRNARELGELVHGSCLLRWRFPALTPSSKTGRRMKGRRSASFMT